MRRTLLATLILFCAVLVAAELRYRGAPVIPRTAGGHDFSAERARDAIAPFASSPHPTGTEALAAARKRVFDHFAGLGLAPSERSSLTCGRYGVCARVSQVTARARGRESTGTVLLLAHLDAVGAGPGASDDGAGVATVLEIARAVAASGPLRNDVLFLVVEGEELGLLGAEAFVRDDPSARDVRAVINVEARGSRGAASLFQISRQSGFLVDAARAITRPVGSSLFVSVYERMPNDTDLTVFLGRGFAGMNFAFTDGVEHYHTARDDLEHQDPRSVQHMGDSALASLRALAAIDLRSPRTSELVFFDVLALGIVRYPLAWALPLSAIALGMLLAGALLAIRARRATIGDLALGVASWLLAIVVATVGGVAIYALVHLSGALPTPWVARPTALLFALIAFALTAVLAAVAVARRLTSMEALSLAIGIVHALLGVVVALVLPGGSYLFVVPALVAGILSMRPRLASAVSAIAQALVWIVVVRSLYPALGTMAAPAIALTTAIMVMPLAPLLLEGAAILARPLSLALGGFAVVAAVIAALSSPFSATVPQRVNVIVAAEDDKPSRVGIDPTWGGQPWGAPPAAMVAALGNARVAPIVPWRDDAYPLGDAGPLDVRAPEVTVLEKGARRLRLSIRSDAPMIYVIAPPGAGLAHVDVAGALGVPTFFRRFIAPGGRGLRIDGAAQIEVTLTFIATPGDIFVASARYGVPAGLARAVVSARPAEAVATQDGDVTIAYRRVRP